MFNTYQFCENLTGHPVCGDNVTSMYCAYRGCKNIKVTGPIIIGPNVTNIGAAFMDCPDIKGDMYIYSNKVNSAYVAFCNRTSARLNIYVPNTGNTISTLLNTTYYITTYSTTWTNDMSTNGCYYSSAYNIYIYPVSNVAAVKEKNEKLVTEYTTISESYAPTFNSGFAYTISNTYNSTTQNYTYTVLANTKGSLPSYISFESVKDTQGRDVDQILSAQASEASVSPLAVFSSYGTVSNVKRINLSKTTNLYKIFNDQSLLNTIDISTCNINNITNMSEAFYFCNALVASPVCGTKVTDMSNAYRYCFNLTGSPVCGPNVTNMSWAYRDCRKLTGSPVCGPNVTNMSNAYVVCSNLTGSPVVGNKVTDMSGAYRSCSNLTGSPVFGPNVTNIVDAYEECKNLKGNPICPNTVTSMSGLYYNCSNLTGSPVCGTNITNMRSAYYSCWRLTGSAACGAKVTDMSYAYAYCNNISIAVCGSNVTTMYGTYQYCNNITTAVCGPNVTNMYRTYYKCPNLYGDFYVSSNNVSNATGCFSGRNNSRRLNIFVNKNTTSYNTLVRTGSTSIVDSSITWTSNASWSCMYNTYYNIYIYPVDDVAQASKTTIRKSLTAAETVDEWNLEADIDWDTEYLEIETDNNRWYGEKLTANMNIYSGMFSLGEGEYGMGIPNTIVFNNELNDLFITDSDMNFYDLNMPNFDMSKASHYIFKIDRTGITVKAFTDTGESTGFLAINTNSFSTYLSEIFALNHIKISGVGNYNSDIEIRAIKY